MSSTLTCLTQSALKQSGACLRPPGDLVSGLISAACYLVLAVILPMLTLLSTAIRPYPYISKISQLFAPPDSGRVQPDQHLDGRDDADELVGPEVAPGVWPDQQERSDPRSRSIFQGGMMANRAPEWAVHHLDLVRL